MSFVARRAKGKPWRRRQQVAFTQREWLPAEHRKHDDFRDERAKASGTLRSSACLRRAVLRTEDRAPQRPAPQARGPPSPQRVAFTQRVWLQEAHRKHKYFGDASAMASGTLGAAPVCGVLRTRRSALQGQLSTPAQITTRSPPLPTRFLLHASRPSPSSPQPMGCLCFQFSVPRPVPKPWPASSKKLIRIHHSPFH